MSTDTIQNSVIQSNTHASAYEEGIVKDYTGIYLQGFAIRFLDSINPWWYMMQVRAI